MNEKAKELGNEPVYPGEMENEWNEGLTKREYFAGLAMQGILTALDYSCPYDVDDAKKNAQESVMFSDSLLFELSK